MSTMQVFARRHKHEHPLPNRDVDAFINKLLRSKRLNALVDKIADRAVEKIRVNDKNSNNETIHSERSGKVDTAAVIEEFAPIPHGKLSLNYKSFTRGVEEIATTGDTVRRDSEESLLTKQYKSQQHNSDESKKINVKEAGYETENSAAKDYDEHPLRSQGRIDKIFNRGVEETATTGETVKKDSVESLLSKQDKSQYEAGYETENPAKDKLRSKGRIDQRFTRGDEEIATTRDIVRKDSIESLLGKQEKSQHISDESKKRNANKAGHATENSAKDYGKQSLRHKGRIDVEETESDQKSREENKYDESDLSHEVPKPVNEPQSKRNQNSAETAKQDNNLSKDDVQSHTNFKKNSKLKHVMALALNNLPLHNKVSNEKENEVNVEVSDESQNEDATKKDVPAMVEKPKVIRNENGKQFTYVESESYDEYHQMLAKAKINAGSDE